jgi:hypothetical protein
MTAITNPNSATGLSFAATQRPSGSEDITPREVYLHMVSRILFLKGKIVCVPITMAALSKA